MAFTDASRNRAYSMFTEGKTTRQVASRLRISVPSATSLRAHWTMQGQPNPSGSTNTRSRSTSTNSSNVVSTVINLSPAQARKVARAYENGQRVSLTIGS